MSKRYFFEGTVSAPKSSLMHGRSRRLSKDPLEALDIPRQTVPRKSVHTTPEILSPIAKPERLGLHCYPQINSVAIWGRRTRFASLFSFTVAPLLFAQASRSAMPLDDTARRPIVLPYFV